MPSMTEAQINFFLSQALVARIATVRPDGRPHVVPIWFYWDGQSIYMETPPDSVKANNLRANPNCAITIDVTEGGLRFGGVILEGQAELLSDRQFQLDMCSQIYAKYLGNEGVLSSTPNQMIHNEHVIIKLIPQKVMSWDDRHTGLAPIP